ncbi:hypothetical protein [Acuticoccus sp. I52.16.1]|uniref:hypothetical protein n=1 Tax=Acuticoccus sp. I52.16.1 TaxID=2928472 RepID=UPI001FD60112|nr:hypothetical protein [Acuticoccus sp. I52.16.1]UOM33078.1 hypothetical protein MRB58_14505 [Acuticoccus sp. I52.16.1]
MCAALCAAGLAAASHPAAAEDKPVLWRSLDAQDLRQRFVGTTIEGVYNNGEAFSEELKADMSTFYRDQDDATPGEYELKGEFICFAYPVAIETGCFRVWQRSANCYDMYIAEGQGFPAVGLYQRMVGTGWDSRFWRADEEPTCPGAQLARAPGPAPT